MEDITVEYIDHLGDDLRVVNAARVSFDKQSDYELKHDTPIDYYEYLMGNSVSDRDARLIKYLAKHNHFTPFTHCSITLRETVPIFVARQRFKHIVGFSYNEVSRRYVDDEPQFYVPDVWRSRPEGSVKQGSGEGEVQSLDFMHMSRNIETVYGDYLDYAADLYDSMLNAGVAPEQARMVLPQSMMTSYYVTGSLAAFARAYKQRTDPHAQKEIRDLAAHWDKIIRPLYPHAWEALTCD